MVQTISGVFGSFDMSRNVEITSTLPVGGGAAPMHRDAVERVVGVGSAKIGVRPGSVAVDVASSGVRVAAVQGQARWLDSSIAALAAEKGPAFAALAGYALCGEELPRYMSGPFALAFADTESRT